MINVRIVLLTFEHNVRKAGNPDVPKRHKISYCFFAKDLQRVRILCRIKQQVGCLCFYKKRKFRSRLFQQAKQKPKGEEKRIVFQRGLAQFFVCYSTTKLRIKNHIAKYWGKIFLLAFLKKFGFKNQIITFFQRGTFVPRLAFF